MKIFEFSKFFNFVDFSMLPPGKKICKNVLKNKIKKVFALKLIKLFILVNLEKLQSNIVRNNANIPNFISEIRKTTYVYYF